MPGEITLTRREGELDGQRRAKMSHTAVAHRRPSWPGPRARASTPARKVSDPCSGRREAACLVSRIAPASLTRSAWFTATRSRSVTVPFLTRKQSRRRDRAIRRRSAPRRPSLRPKVDSRRLAPTWAVKAAARCESRARNDPLGLRALRSRSRPQPSRRRLNFGAAAYRRKLPRVAATRGRAVASVSCGSFVWSLCRRRSADVESAAGLVPSHSCRQTTAARTPRPMVLNTKLTVTVVPGDIGRRP